MPLVPICVALFTWRIVCSQVSSCRANGNNLWQPKQSQEVLGTALCTFMISFMLAMQEPEISRIFFFLSLGLLSLLA